MLGGGRKIGPREHADFKPLELVERLETKESFDTPGKSRLGGCW